MMDRFTYRCLLCGVDTVSESQLPIVPGYGYEDRNIETRLATVLRRVDLFQPIFRTHKCADGRIGTAIVVAAERIPDVSDVLTGLGTGV